MRVYQNMTIAMIYVSSPTGLMHPNWNRERVHDDEIHIVKMNK